MYKHKVSEYCYAKVYIAVLVSCFSSCSLQNAFIVHYSDGALCVFAC